MYDIIRSYPVLTSNNCELLHNNAKDADEY